MTLHAGDAEVVVDAIAPGPEGNDDFCLLPAEDDEARSIYSLDARRHLNIVHRTAIPASPRPLRGATPLDPARDISSGSTWQRGLQSLRDKFRVFSFSLIAGNLGFSVLEHLPLYMALESATPRTDSSAVDLMDGRVSFDGVCLFLASMHICGAWISQKKGHDSIYLERRPVSSLLVDTATTNAPSDTKNIISHTTAPIITDSRTAPGPTRTMSSKATGVLLTKAPRLMTAADMSEILRTRSESSSRDKSDAAMCIEGGVSKKRDSSICAPRVSRAARRGSRKGKMSRLGAIEGSTWLCTAVAEEPL